MKQQKESWRREYCFLILILTLRLSVPEFDKVQRGKHEETKQKRQEHSDDERWLLIRLCLQARCRFG
ncbi:hypothetical protein NC651_015255 [Populus alba x Populus x berolinensis]|nr:hypothetical protein NC651_015255 [Populus alba x Populus x berolinensis]